jgi:phospholipase/lecithinase/hemolysin
MHRIDFSFACLLGALLSSGCAMMSARYEPKRIDLNVPRVDIVNVAQVGDSLLFQGNYSEHDAIHVQSEIGVGTLSAIGAGIFASYTIRPGFYTKEGENEVAEFFRPSTYGNGGEILKNPLADSWKWVQAYKDRNTICIVTMLNLAVCTHNAAFKRTRQPIATPNSLQQSLIYSGKMANKVKIGYREFSGNLARPAFNNDVEYDLTESSVIGYKGARIQVIEATNEFIRYRVIRSFNSVPQDYPSFNAVR